MTDSTTATPSPSAHDRQPWLDRLVTLSDDQFVIPGTNIRFGLDAVIGFILPELGDSITGLLGGIVLLVAWKDGAPPALLARMAGNIAIDVVAGMVPILGDMLDVAYRANRRNHTLLRNFQRERDGVTFSLEHPPLPVAGRDKAPSWLLATVLITLLVVLLALPIGLLVLVGNWLLS
jgi:hypothetical protein